MYTLYSRPGSGGFVAEAALFMADVPSTLVNRRQDRRQRCVPSPSARSARFRR